MEFRCLISVGSYMGMHTHRAPVFHISLRPPAPLSFVGITQGLYNPPHPTTSVVERLQLHCVLADTRARRYTPTSSAPPACK